MKKIAIRAIQEAGKILIDYLKGDIPEEIKQKGLDDIVTNADLGSGNKIKEIILQEFPDHQILFEENELDQVGKSEYTWFVDPLDGTVYMKRKFPKIGIYLGLNKAHETILALAYNPYNDDLFIAEKNQGSTLINETHHINKTLTVSDINTIDQSYIGYAHGKSKESIRETADFIKQVMPNCYRVSKLVGTEVCYVASGSFEAYLSNVIDPWETLVLSLITVEAGGKATDFNGQLCDQYSKNIVLSNGLIHDKILQIVQTTH